MYTNATCSMCKASEQLFKRIRNVVQIKGLDLKSNSLYKLGDKELKKNVDITGRNLG